MEDVPQNQRANTNKETITILGKDESFRYGVIMYNIFIVESSFNLQLHLNYI